METIYSNRELSGFCMQAGLLLSAAVPLDEGFRMMAIDAKTEKESKMLKNLAEEVELGEPVYLAMEKEDAFPPYVIRMAKLGQETGTLEETMFALSTYYDKEYRLLKAVKNALTYPVIMIFMLLTVLFVLFTQVMPVFEDVYEQLGAQISPVSKAAIDFGGIFSGIALGIAAVLVVVIAIVYVMTLFDKKIAAVEQFINWIKRRSKIAVAVSMRRFASVLAITMQSGMELEKGIALAGELVDNTLVKEKIEECGEDMVAGESYYEALKKMTLFSAFHIQMIQVGTRSGHLDRVMQEISNDYEQEADVAIDNMIARFEPAVVAVLAVSVGLVLLSVMLPLMGVLSTIG